MTDININIDTSLLWTNLNQRLQAHTRQKDHLPPELMPSEDTFPTLVSVAFNASLQTEEKRRTGFRLIYFSLEELERDRKHDDPSNRYRIMPFENRRSFETRELVQIAAVADITRLLVCVCLDEKTNELQIWGLMDTGESWWRVIQHQSFFGNPPPHFLTITSTRPGELSFSLHGNILVVLKDGKLTYPLPDPICSGPISLWLQYSRKALFKQVIRNLGTDRWSEERSDEGFSSEFYDSFLKKVLINIRSIGHGGILVVVPHEITSIDPRLSDRVLLKYKSEFDYAWSYLTAFLVNEYELDGLQSPSNSQEASSSELFHKFRRLEEVGDRLFEKIDDTAKSIASLTGVDGAVVITNQFRVLGFGGEIIAESPSLEYVTHATENQTTTLIESFGTRHRSAFRFCSSFEDSVAFIFSSDGGVRAAKRVGKELLYWADINAGELGL